MLASIPASILNHNCSRVGNPKSDSAQMNPALDGGRSRQLSLKPFHKLTPHHWPARKAWLRFQTAQLSTLLAASSPAASFYREGPNGNFRRVRARAGALQDHDLCARSPSARCVNDAAT